MNGRAGEVARAVGTPVWRAADDDRPRTLLVSDLHVPLAGGEVLRGFVDLLALATSAAAATRVLVLGDLFEALANERMLRLGCWPQLLDALRRTTAAGVPVTVLHGNRDYMLGRRFAAATGARVVAGGLAFRLGDRAALALHGDELCLHDVRYQRSKRWLRSAPVRALCRALPAGWARRVARRARAVSTGRPAHDREVYRAVGAAAREAVAAVGAELLVFGHVHEPGRGRMAGVDAELLVLPAFDDALAFAEHDPGAGLRFRTVARDPLPDFPPYRLA